MSSEESMELVKDYHATDKAAFEVVYKQYFSTIYRFCYSLVGKTDVAEDITQETFMKLLQLNDQFYSIRNVRAFLYVASRNACLSYFQYEKRKQQASLDLMREAASDDYTRLNDELDGLHYQAIKNAIKKLPLRKREIIQKHYVEDLDAGTISEQMDIKIDSFYSMHSRAVALLKKWVLGPNMEEVFVLLFIFCFSL